MRDLRSATHGMSTPQTRYAKSGDVHIAYQVVGEGPVDLVLVHGWVTNIELFWEDPGWSSLFRRLASFVRLIMFDKRGTGLPDRVSVGEMPTLEERMDDVRAVMDAVGSTQAFVFGISEGGPMSLLFAATYPERARGLVLYGSFPRILSGGDYPWGFAPEQLEPIIELAERTWGDGTFSGGLLAGDTDAILGHVEEFVTGKRGEREPDRVLATVMFTDIVDSTVQAAALGDRRWSELLEGHDQLIRQQLQRFGGQEIKTIGDGFLVTFDGPARGIRCALATVQATNATGLSLRAGLHTGECERRGGDISGIAVYTGARVAALAGAGEVLVSRTVKDLVAGSGLQFEDRGTHNLRGVPDDWQLFAVSG